MELDQLLTKTTVVGAAGKVGKIVAALVLQEVAKLKIQYPDRFYTTSLLDEQEAGFEDTRQFARQQLTNIAEKSIVRLREHFTSREDLVENREVIDEFVNTSVGAVRCDTEPAIAKGSRLIFDATGENRAYNERVMNELKLLELSAPVIECVLRDPPDKKNPVALRALDDAGEELKEAITELGERFKRKFI